MTFSPGRYSFSLSTTAPRLRVAFVHGGQWPKGPCIRHRLVLFHNGVPMADEPEMEEVGGEAGVDRNGRPSDRIEITLSLRPVEALVNDKGEYLGVPMAVTTKTDGSKEGTLAVKEEAVIDKQTIIAISKEEWLRMADYLYSNVLKTTQVDEARLDVEVLQDLEMDVILEGY